MEVKNKRFAVRLQRLTWDTVSVRVTAFVCFGELSSSLVEWWQCLVQRKEDEIK